MIFVDAHVHIFERISGYAAKGECRAIGNGLGQWANGKVERFVLPGYGEYGFSAESLLKLLDQNGIDKAMIMQGSNYGFHNDYIAECVRNYPERLAAACSVDPYVGDCETILERMISTLGYRSVKFEFSSMYGLRGVHPYARLNDTAFEKVYTRAAESGLTVIFDLGAVGTDSCRYEPLREVAMRFPTANFVLAHAFSPRDDGRNSDRLRWIGELVSDNMYFDISNLPPEMDEPFPFPSQQSFLKEMKRLTGADRMLWGTDSPGTLLKIGYSELRDYILRGDVFTEDELRLVMGENALRLYFGK